MTHRPRTAAVEQNECPSSDRLARPSSLCPTSLCYDVCVGALESKRADSAEKRRFTCCIAIG
jgi:hypothetical protein